MTDKRLFGYADVYVQEDHTSARIGLGRRHVVAYQTARPKVRLLCIHSLIDTSVSMSEWGRMFMGWDDPASLDQVAHHLSKRLKKMLSSRDGLVAEGRDPRELPLSFDASARVLAMLRGADPDVVLSPGSAFYGLLYTEAGKKKGEPEQFRIWAFPTMAGAKKWVGSCKDDDTTLIAATADDLQSLDMAVIIRLFNSLTGDDRDRFRDDQEALVRTFGMFGPTAKLYRNRKELEMATKGKKTATKKTAAKAAPAKKGGKTKGKVSYQTILRDLFTKKKKVTKDAIMKALGCDSKNAAVAVSILRNPKRTKEPMKIQYDRKTETYSLLK